MEAFNGLKIALPASLVIWLIVFTIFIMAGVYG